MIYNIMKYIYAKEFHLKSQVTYFFVQVITDKTVKVTPLFRDDECSFVT